MALVKCLPDRFGLGINEGSLKFITLFITGDMSMLSVIYCLCQPTHEHRLRIVWFDTGAYVIVNDHTSHTNLLLCRNIRISFNETGLNRLLAYYIRMFYLPRRLERVAITMGLKLSVSWTQMLKEIQVRVSSSLDVKTSFRLKKNKQLQIINEYRSYKYFPRPRIEPLRGRPA